MAIRGWLRRQGSPGQRELYTISTTWWYLGIKPGRKSRPDLARMKKGPSGWAPFLRWRPSQDPCRRSLAYRVPGVQSSPGLRNVFDKRTCSRGRSETSITPGVAHDD